MRILWISHLLPYPPTGGVRIRSFNLLAELCKSNEVHFVGLFQQAHQPSSESYQAGVSALERICRSVIVHPFESFRGRLSWFFLIIRSLFSRKSFKELWASSTSLTRSIRECLNRHDIDVVHFDTIVLLQYRKILPDSIPVSINHHNIESSMSARRAGNQKNPFARLFFHLEAAKLKRLETRHCPSTDNLVVSALDGKRLQSIVPDSHIEIIPNGVDLKFFQRLEEPYIERSLLWIGGMTWYPNLQAVQYILTEIWPRLVESVEGARLFLVGRNPPDSVIKLAEQYDNVELLGFVDDIRPLMSGVSGFICPIRDGGGTRLKVLNAMAMGVPLIATSMSCEGIPVLDGENVLLAETPREFVEQAGRVFVDGDLRHRLSNNAMALIKNEFDNTVIGQKLHDSYSRRISV